MLLQIFRHKVQCLQALAHRLVLGERRAGPLGPLLDFNRRQASSKAEDSLLGLGVGDWQGQDVTIPQNLKRLLQIVSNYLRVNREEEQDTWRKSLSVD